MKIKYRPTEDAPWSEFDPSCEIICPNCGHVKPMPRDWLPWETIIVCDQLNPRQLRSDGKCGTAMFDLIALFGEKMKYALGYRIAKGQLDKENVMEWARKYIQWEVMRITGGAPRWRVTPPSYDHGVHQVYPDQEEQRSEAER